MAYQPSLRCSHPRGTTEDKATMDLERFKETVGLVREKCPDIIINMTSSGVLALVMRSASFLTPFSNLTWAPSTRLHELYQGVFVNSPTLPRETGKAYIENGIKPEVEVFDAGMVWNAKRLQKDGFLQAPIHFQCCMHVFGAWKATRGTWST